MEDSPNRDFLVFTEAIHLSAAERGAYLKHACGNDDALRQRVEALLQTHNKVGDFLEIPPQKPMATPTSEIPTSEKVGDYVGRYKLVQQIGEGGCGVVFLAEQDEPVRRRVALKMIKPGMDSKSVIARFQSERQALALMDHPNIAKVFDAGTTRCGRPYFVMELIRGSKITDYCDQHSLTTVERLKLFIEVCQAVQHAHQKGIIHRDIKPSNILVTTTLEGAALPVVIDFGIAKATTNQRLTDKTVFTAFEMLIGTPAYMSPEQAESTGYDMDTRTDIYSLGVLLYELLTGSTPFDTESLLKAGIDQIRRVIREQEPARPSTRLSKMTAADLTSVAQRRRAEPPVLIRAICGDLDWIVMKALEKDRTRRYETANGLALDVQRYLADEPILARPPSQIYKLKKTVLRNKFLFGGTGVIALLLVISLIIVSRSLAHERQARRLADAALRQAEVDKAIAQTAAVKSRQVTQFLENMLQGVGPSVALGQDTKMLRGILDRTAANIGPELTNQPAVEAELRSLIGRLYWEIGNYIQAENMQRAALALDQKLFGDRSPETATAWNDLGLALCKEDNLAAAETAHEQALALRRQLFGEENADVATSLNDLATVVRHQGRRTEAEALTRQALGIRQKLFGTNSLEAAATLHNLSVELGDEGKQAEAEVVARQLLAMRRGLLGNEDPLIAEALVDVAWAARVNGKPEEAKSVGEQALAMQRKTLGDEAPIVTHSLDFLGQLLASDGKREEAHAVLKAALSIQCKLLGADHPASLSTLRNLGLLLESEGDFAEAETAHREALALWHQHGETETPQVLAETASLVQACMAQKKFDAAEKILDEVLTPALVLKPASADLLTLRFELMGRHGRWSAAAADAARLVQLQPAEHYHYHRLAGLLAKTGDLVAYQTLCRNILVLFGNASDEYVTERMANDCLLLPDSGVDLSRVKQLADRAVAASSNNVYASSYCQGCKALVEYRLGHFSDAVQWSERALKNPVVDVNAQAKASAVAAMAQWQLGQQDAARDLLTKGNILAPDISSMQDDPDLGGTWVAWLFARISLDEAAGLIHPERSVTPKAK